MHTRRYVIGRAACPPPLSGRVAGTAWAQAAAARIDRFCWYIGGARQGTTVRILYDRANLYLQFRCRDRHISAAAGGLNGPVWQDSCVEFFATIEPQGAPGYFNLEINCCGVFLLGFGPDRHHRRLIGSLLAGRIRIAASAPGATKAESPLDRSWWVAAAVPLDILSAFTGRPVRPRAGDVWRGNLYRCGGLTDPQHASWNPITTAAPDYHRPECFGILRFA